MAGMLKSLIIFVVCVSCSNCENEVVTNRDEKNITLVSVDVTLLPPKTTYRLDEGEPLTVDCSANCDPPCEYKWYPESLNATSGRLYIPNVPESLDYNALGSLYCMAYNNESGPFSSEEIHVYIGQKPTNVKIFRDGVELTNHINVTLGMTINISVSAICDPACTFRWYGGYPDKGSHYDKNFFLQRNATMEHQGPWSLHTHNNRGSVYKNININVQYPPMAFNLQPNSTSMLITSCDNHTVQFLGKCKPACTYRWYKEGIKTPIQYSNMLWLQNLAPNISGTYHCIAQNELGKTKSKDVRIDIGNLECTEKLPLTTNRISKQAGVTIYPDYDQYISVGASISFNCSAQCQSECNYQWISPFGNRSGQMLTHIATYEDVDREVYVYCIAWKSVDGPEASSVIKLNYRYGTEYVSIEHNKTSIDVVEGTGFKFRCDGECNPVCSTYWEDKYSHHSWIGYSTELSERSIQKHYRGKIRCRKSNLVKSTYGTVYLNIQYSPTDHQLFPNKSNLMFKTDSCRASIFTVAFLGQCNPECSYVWYRNNTPISIGNILTIYNIDQQKEGLYHCEGYNRYGNVTSDSITVKTENTVQTKIVQLNATNDIYKLALGTSFGPIKCTCKKEDCRLHWKTPNGNFKQSIIYVQSIMDKDYGIYTCLEDKVDNTTDSLNCESKTITVEREESLLNATKEMRYKDLGPIYNITLYPDFIPISSYTSSISAECRSSKESVCQYKWIYPGGESRGKRLHLARSYFDDLVHGEVYCVVECPGLGKQRSQKLEILHGPLNIQFNATKTIYEVTEITDPLGPFFCNATCNPACSVYWYHDRSSAAYKTTLYSSQVSTSEAGEWYCYIWNNYDSYTSKTFQIDVKHGPKTPRLIPRTALYDYRPNPKTSFGPIRCVAYCNPTCTYVWYKDDVVMSNANVLLIDDIQPRDHGNYTCVAYNYLNRVHSSRVELILYDEPESVTYFPTTPVYHVKHGDLIGPINCSAVCNPPCDFYWQTPTGRYDDQLLELNISALSQGGYYYCHAWNKNSDWKSVHLYIDYDPCNGYYYRTPPDIGRRCSECKKDGDVVDDSVLEEYWYRDHFRDIPTKPPQRFRCGTAFPIWLQGTLPKVNQTIDMETCTVKDKSQCEYPQNISVRNCGDYRVYKLRPALFQSSAYCFDQINTDASVNTVSDVRLHFQGITWTPEHPRYGFIRKHPSVKFRCRFKPLKDPELFYEITWFVSDRFQSKDVISAKDTAEAYGHPVISKIGEKISCAVSALISKGGRPGKGTKSNYFDTNIKVTIPVRYTIPRGGSVTLKVRPAIPFACTDKLDVTTMTSTASPDCSMGIILKTAEPTLSLCNRCSKLFGYYSEASYVADRYMWNKTYDITLCHKDDGVIGKDNVHEIHLSMNKTQLNKENSWGEVELPTFKIEVADNGNLWSRSYCYDLLDPHLRTFDGRYFDSHQRGSYILYRNNKTSQEIQVYHQPCDGTGHGAHCVCGIAARAGYDIFKIDICDQNNFIDYENCTENILVVKIVSEKYYKIQYPTGTWVDIHLITRRRPYYMNIRLYPSVYDEYNTEGLCGNLDGDNTNDLVNRFTREKIPMDTRTPDKFSESWRSYTEYDMFNMEKYIEQSNYRKPIKYCTCLHSEEKGYQESCTYKNDVSWKSYKNIDCRRRKRSVYYHHVTKIKRSTHTINLVKLKNESEYHCTHLMNTDILKECKQKVQVMDDSFHENCVLDYMYTGNDKVSEDALEASYSACSSFVGKNASFAVVDTDFVTLVDNICPNNCSGNGICNEGNCTCFDNHGGADCSFDMTAPPFIQYVSGNGSCDSRHEDCSEVMLTGSKFLDDRNSSCRVKRFKIMENGTQIHNGQYTVKGESRSLFEGVCPLQFNNEDIGLPYITMFSIAYANDENRYSEDSNTTVHDSECQRMNKTKFVHKKGFCFINNTCYNNREQKPGENLCKYCDTSETSTSWTMNKTSCMIDGTCYGNGQHKSEDEQCWICDVSVQGNGNWSLDRNSCWIGNKCYRHGDTFNGMSCKVCNVSDQGQYEWSLNRKYCYIDGECFENDKVDNNACYKCNVYNSTENWSFNTKHCLINGTCYENGNVDEEQPCNMCVSHDNISFEWGLNAVYCKINGECYEDGTLNPADPCSLCNISAVGQYEWATNASEECQNVPESTTSYIVTSEDISTSTRRKSTTENQPQSTTEAEIPPQPTTESQPQSTTEAEILPHSTTVNQEGSSPTDEISTTRNIQTTTPQTTSSTEKSTSTTVESDTTTNNDNSKEAPIPTVKTLHTNSVTTTRSSEPSSFDKLIHDKALYIGAGAGGGILVIIGLLAFLIKFTCYKGRANETNSLLGSTPSSESDSPKGTISDGTWYRNNAFNSDLLNSQSKKTGYLIPRPSIISGSDVKYGNDKYNL